MTSIFLSNRPGLKRAESKISGLFVAAITIIPELSAKPSNSVKS
jgi:hypothetical protein